MKAGLTRTHCDNHTLHGIYGLLYRIESSTEPDHVTDETRAYYNASSHKANSLLRGIKGDTYEGGHRVPFIVRWPAQIPAGKKVDETICLTDIFEKEKIG